MAILTKVTFKAPKLIDFLKENGIDISNQNGVFTEWSEITLPSGTSACIFDEDAWGSTLYGLEEMGLPRILGSIGLGDSFVLWLVNQLVDVGEDSEDEEFLSDPENDCTDFCKEIKSIFEEIYPDEKSWSKIKELDDLIESAEILYFNNNWDGEDFDYTYAEIKNGQAFYWDGYSKKEPELYKDWNWKDLNAFIKLVKVNIPSITYTRKNSEWVKEGNIENQASGSDKGYENIDGAIDDFWAQDFFDSTTIIIPDGVTSVRFEAFYNCINLTSVVIPDSVTSIGEYAFDGCTSLESVVIPSGVINLGDGAFECCDSLKSVEIPASVTSIGDSAFFDCTSLASINVDKNNKSFSSIDGVLFSKDKTILIQYPIGKEATEYIIPDGVTSIYKEAFRSCENLESITIPDSVKNIGEYAFDGCANLTTIAVPSGVTDIGEGTFECCDSLTSVTIPDSVTHIDDYAFTDLENLTIHAPAGSYAEQYAKENGFPFIVE